MDFEKWIMLMAIGVFGLAFVLSMVYIIAIIWALVRVTLHFT